MNRVPRKSFDLETVQAEYQSNKLAQMLASNVSSELQKGDAPSAPPPRQEDKPNWPTDIVSAFFRQNWFSLMLMLALVEVSFKDMVAAADTGHGEKVVFAAGMIIAYSLVFMLSAETRLGGLARILMYWILQALTIIRGPVVFQLQREEDSIW